MLEEHLAAGWEYAVEVVVAAPLDRVQRYLSPALGRLEPVEAEATRLRGSTSSPAWYAEQLAGIPDSFTVVGGPEVQHAVAALGRRLLEGTRVSELTGPSGGNDPTP